MVARPPPNAGRQLSLSGIRDTSSRIFRF